jgi:tRNA threonylcarbamoyladenosine biosynthesis protein TsaB
VVIRPELFAKVNPMWHLALETIGLAGSVALFKDTQLVANFPLPSQIGSARSLLPAIDQVVREASITSSDLGLISLANGPGSFTGLRVSVASAKAIGYALNVPLCAVDTLETLAYRLGCGASADTTKPILIAAAMDAYRKQVFRLVALVEPVTAPATSGLHDVKLHVLIPSHHLDVALWKQNPFHGLEAATAQLQLPVKWDPAVNSGHQTVIVGGNAIARYPFADDLQKALTHSDPTDITAVDVGRYAWRQWLAGTRTDPFHLLPNYLRASAAEEKVSSVASNDSPAV